MTYFDKKVIAAFVLGLFVGVAASALWVLVQGDRSNPNDENEAKTEEVTAQEKEEITSETAPISGNTLSVADQLAGNTVIVDRVSISSAGWVAVHEDVDGALGNILGAARFPEGEHDGIVPLLRETVAGEKYHAVLYFDNGDREFNFNEDTLLEAQPGVPLVTTFETF